MAFGAQREKIALYVSLEAKFAEDRLTGCCMLEHKQWRRDLVTIDTFIVNAIDCFASHHLFFIFHYII